ncbi:MAG TPA: c-type cytochrome [Terriglobales bacterium]|nr:c-type cytochrome [Terriglobales bacterium]
MGISSPGFRWWKRVVAILAPFLFLFVTFVASESRPSPAVNKKQTTLQWAGEPEGAKRCVVCHRAEVEGYARSAMAHSLRRSAKEPDGAVTTADTQINVSNRETGYWQTLVSGGETTNYRIDYVIGSGNHASGYLLDLADHLFQSPIAYYKTRRTYDLAPGYEGLANPDFTRPVTEACLFCHSGTALPDPGTRNKYHSPPFSAEAITCERCHGPVEKHLADPRAGTIVNPAKLDPIARDSICEQCHLLGVGRVLNPGKKFSDFVPGERLEDVFTTDHLVLPAGEDSGKFKVISHVEQFAKSTCSRMSAGRMWCGTCHDPHDKPLDPVQYFRNKCLSCHTAALPTPHPDKTSNCIGCHMPRRNANDGGHTVFTDHRIERRPSIEQPLPENIDIAAWREPAPEFQKRNLGISYVNFGAERRSPEFLVRGYRLLTQVQQQFSNDDALFTAIGTALLLGKQPKEAEFAFDRALQLNPNSVSGETNDASAYLQAGDVDQAIAHLERAVTLDPLDLTAVAPLINLYKERGNPARANELSANIDQALKRQAAPATENPQLPPMETLPAEEGYKNIEVLKGVPAGQLIPTMRFIAQSLGVECNYCHVPGHFEDDTMKTKQTARQMMRMMNSINRNSFDGLRAVTCYSCHRGSARPENIPQIGKSWQPGITSEISEKLVTSLPSADQIVGNYIQALGGIDALQQIQSREADGTVTSGGTVAEIEILDKFPDRHASIQHLPAGKDYTILDGGMGWWGTVGRSFHNLQTSDLDAESIVSDLHFPIDLTKRFAELRVEYPEKVGSRDAYLLLACRTGTPPVKLYFEEKTGLLIRMVQFADSPLGSATQQTDYDDYRMVDGVNVPFRWTATRGNEASTIQLEKVLLNVPIDDQRFARPAH